MNNLVLVNNNTTLHPFVFNLNVENLMAHARASPNYTVVKENDNQVYRGQTAVNKTTPHGIGAMSYNTSTGQVYVGDWFNGKRHGIGYYNFADGNKYIGYWSNDTRHGQGTQFHADGSIFTGSYENGKRQGFGVYTYKSGNQYFGNWANGKRDTQGFYRFANGDLYSGNWSADTRNGQGMALYDKNATSYNGNWCNGVKHGHGALKSGEVIYTGEFKKGVRSGMGKLEFVQIVSFNFDYRWYEGEWQDNQMHGTGKMLMRTGDVVEGMYEQGKRVKVLGVQPSLMKRNMYSTVRSLRRQTFADVTFQF